MNDGVFFQGVCSSEVTINGTFAMYCENSNIRGVRFAENYDSSSKLTMSTAQFFSNVGDLGSNVFTDHYTDPSISYK
jgi:hypothetical protein